MVRKYTWSKHKACSVLDTEYLVLITSDNRGWLKHKA